MNLNRQQQPDFKDVENINIPIPKKLNLDNGIETYYINAGTQDIIKIDITFNAGNWCQEKPLIAMVVNKMLIEGTHKLNSQQIAEKLDFYGAFIHTDPTKDFGNITLYTLKKYLPETILILEDVIKNPIFPENELQIFLNKKKQQFQIELEKVTIIARREFIEQLFGENHPYGKNTMLEDYDHINRDDIIEFHKKFYHPENCNIMLSGKINDSDISLVNQYFGNKDWKAKTNVIAKNHKIVEVPKPETFVEKENATQSAIRLGKLMINQNHPDFHKLNIVNTILGGYFGSRLMKSIREEKGYTYGISSVLIPFKNATYLVILSEVGANVAKDAITDILAEIKKLREEKVSQEELSLVQNYMAGSLLRSFDGPFEISAAFRNIIDLDLDTDFYNKAVETLKTISPDEIQDIANKYFHEDTLIRTIAGKYS
ncbi:MAG: insulinase family protein [Bacteroidales bacterium]|nr:insulinase family protein [Bacteroidales bacterium]